MTSAGSKPKTPIPHMAEHVPSLSWRSTDAKSGVVRFSSRAQTRPSRLRIGKPQGSDGDSHEPELVNRYAVPSASRSMNAVSISGGSQFSGSGGRSVLRSFPAASRTTTSSRAPVRSLTGLGASTPSSRTSSGYVTPGAEGSNANASAISPSSRIAGTSLDSQKRPSLAHAMIAPGSIAGASRSGNGPRLTTAVRGSGCPSVTSSWISSPGVASIGIRKSPSDEISELHESPLEMLCTVTVSRWSRSVAAPGRPSTW